MLRSATKQTSRVLCRSRTISRVAQSVCHHSAGGTEGALLIPQKLAVVGFVVGIGGTIAYFADDQIEAGARLLGSKDASYRSRNTEMMRDKWSSLAPSRKAVLNKRYNSRYFNLHKLLGMANKSEVDQSTPAPKSVADVIGFFIEWRYYHNNKTINTTRLKELLGSECITLHTILTEIRDDEAKGWHQMDSDNLNKVVDFLDKISEMEMNR